MKSRLGFRVRSWMDTSSSPAGHMAVEREREREREREKWVFGGFVGEVWSSGLYVVVLG